jgi:hypothetical protein
MQFTLITTIAALALGTNAAVLRRQGAADPRLAQFRVFSDYGCSNLNEGFYTVDQDQSNQCQAFTDTTTPNGYVSIVLQDLETAGSDCKRKYTMNWLKSSASSGTPGWHVHATSVDKRRETSI